MLKDSPCFIGLKKNEPALKAKVDTLIEQGIKDGTLNGLSEKPIASPPIVASTVSCTVTHRPASSSGQCGQSSEKEKERTGAEGESGYPDRAGH
jgi:hypothetical protein